MTATYDCIATTTLSSAQATVTFSSISANYTDLVLVMNAGFNSNTGYGLNMRFNGVTSSQYSSTVLEGNGSSAASFRYNAAGTFTLGLPGRNTLDSNFIINIMNYSNTTTNKTVILRNNYPAVATWAVVGLWQNTAAINEISLYPEVASWLSGSTFTLYGIKSEA